MQERHASTKEREDRFRQLQEKMFLANGMGLTEEEMQEYEELKKERS